jgi:uncharacterized membrane protein
MNDILTIVSAWLATGVLQLLAVPFLLPRFKADFIDGGWSLGRLLSWLAIGLPIWCLANFKLPANTAWGVTTMTFFLIAISVFFWKRKRQEIFAVLREKWAVILCVELVFAFGFFFMSAVRCFGPEIQDLEKFMDIGLMASYLRTPTLPVLDMWFSGHTMNYYTFGHFLGTVMTRFWGLDALAYSYNLLLPLIMGLMLSQSFSLIASLILKTKIISNRIWPAVTGGLLGAALIVYGGNTQAIWSGLVHHGWKGYWYPDATRFIADTIHEFPSYGFIVSDLHAHVWDFPIVLLLLAMTTVWYQRVMAQETYGKIYRAAGGIGLILGIMVMTNTWDGVIYGLFLLIAGISLMVFSPKQGKMVFYSALLVLLTTICVSAFWWSQFEPFSKGVHLVQVGTPLWQLIVVWAGMVILSALAFMVAAKQREASQCFSSEVKARQNGVWGFILCLCLASWILLLIPELIYIKDIYDGNQRANTMFKFTLQAFILMGITGGWVAGLVFPKDFLVNRPLGKIGRKVCLILILLVSAGQLLYPYFGYRDRFVSFKNFQGLNGLGWMAKQYPNDYAAIQWLIQNVKGQPVILEAVGTSYSTFARVSAFTGLPTVLGWPVHEWLWRGSNDVAGPREEEVKKMYEAPLSEEAALLFEKYNVEYIFVGKKEYEAYTQMDPSQFLKMGRVVFEQGDTVIIRREGSCMPAYY